MAKTTDNNNSKEYKATQAQRAGGWVIPLDVKRDDDTIERVWALQINKTKSDKADFDNIHQAYLDKDIEVLTYKGKNDADVYLVDADDKLSFRQPSVSMQKMIASMVDAGLSKEQALQAYKSAKNQ